jgi:anti-anti-sigma factor
MPPGKLLFAECRNTLVVKLQGRMGYSVSADFDRFVDEVFACPGFDAVLVDLTDTTAIDSTNLGLLAKVAKNARQKLKQRASLVSTNEEITEILLNVGLDKIFQLVEHSDVAPDALESVRTGSSSEAEMARTMLAAHELLAELNERNACEFKDVVEFLRRELDS